MGQETSYQYDATGRLTRKTDALGQRIGYGYDSNGRVNQIVQTGSETKTINFTYDDVGNLLVAG
jgi:YD repeat-containing protein